MVLEDRLGRGGAVLAEMRSAMPHVSPHESLKALMEDRGLKHKNIWPVPGNKGAQPKYSAAAGRSARRKQNGWRSSSTCPSTCSSERYLTSKPTSSS